MPDFSQLLRRPAGGHKKPPVLPPGDYEGVIVSHLMDESGQKKTPYLRIMIRPSGWPANVPDSWEVFNTTTGQMETVTKEMVDLTKKQLRKDFYLTEDAFWRLDEFLAAEGVLAEGKTYEECFPELVGKPVLMEVINKQNQDGESFAEVNKVSVPA